MNELAETFSRRCCGAWETEPHREFCSAAQPDIAQADTKAWRLLAANWSRSDGHIRNALEDACEVIDSLRAQLSAAKAASREMAYEEQLWAQRVRKAEARLAAVEAACAAYGSCAYGNDPEDLCACLVCQVRAAARGEADR